MITLKRLLLTLVLVVSTLSQAQSVTLAPIISILLQDESECKVGTTVAGYIELNTQADVDELRGVSTVLGSLIIYPGAGLDFTPLNQLSNVLVEFRIAGGQQTQIIGFNCLETVGGGFKIVSNSGLNEINAFANLASVGEGQNGGNFQIESNLALTSITGFSKLTTVGSSIELVSNIEIRNIDAFANLASLGGNLFIRQNTLLTSISGFGKLLSMPNGELAISSNDSLASINDFESLSSAIVLSIFQNSELTSIGGFESLSSLNTGLGIFSNPKLTSIAGFGSLEAAGIGQSTINSNTLFDCPSALLHFSPIDISVGNSVDCL